MNVTKKKKKEKKKPFPWINAVPAVIDLTPHDAHYYIYGVFYFLLWACL